MFRFLAHRHVTSWAAGLLVAVFGGAQHAHAESEGGWGSNFELYLGAGVGGSPMTLDKQDFSTSGTFVSTISGDITTVTQDESLAKAYKGFIGLRLFKFFGVEVGAGDLGTVSYTAEGFRGFNAITDKGDYSASMTYVAGLLTIPTDDHGSYFHLKAGTAKVRTELKEVFSEEGFADTTTVTSVTSQRPLIGLGYTMATGKPHERLRFEVEHFGEIGKAYDYGVSPGRASVTLFSASYMVAF